MPINPANLKQANLPESAFVYDEADHEWVLAFRRDFKRYKPITLIDAVTFNASVTSKTGNAFEVSPYAKGLLLINLDVTGAPTDIVIAIQFSKNNVNWFTYILGPFGDLRYEDAAGDKTECLDIPILAKFIRAYVVATGTDASKTFKLTLDCVLNG